MHETDETELQQLFAALADRLRHARAKHAWPRGWQSRYYTLTVLVDEVEELRQAVKNQEGRSREMDEALDVMTVAARYWLGDHLPEGEK